MRSIAILGCVLLAALAPDLMCPNCGEPLGLRGDALVCEAGGHAFDVARQGYVSLLAPGRRAPAGDTLAMVDAREAFLGRGRPYHPITEAIARAAAGAGGGAGGALDGGVGGGRGLVVDVGAGTGHHLAALLEAVPFERALALDSSVYALRRAARAHPRIAAVRCDVWHSLPVRSGAADLVLDVFSPRNGPEIARILSSEGALVVVTPTVRHLAELRGPLGLLDVPEAKAQRLEVELAPRFSAVARDEVEVALSLDAAQVLALVGMGPSAHHVGADALRRAVAGLPEPVEVTASVVVQTLQLA